MNGIACDVIPPGEKRQYILPINGRFAGFSYDRERLNYTAWRWLKRAIGRDDRRWPFAMTLAMDGRKMVSLTVENISKRVQPITASVSVMPIEYGVMVSFIPQVPPEVNQDPSLWRLA